MADIRKLVNACHQCGKERVRLRTDQATLKLFTVIIPLESVALDVLEPLPRTSKGHQYLLVVNEMFSKMTHTILLMTMAHAFLHHWILHYALTDNSLQFTSKLFQFVCQILKAKNAFTISYYPNHMARLKDSTARYFQVFDTLFITIQNPGTNTLAS